MRFVIVFLIRFRYNNSGGEEMKRRERVGSVKKRMRKCRKKVKYLVLFLILSIYFLIVNREKIFDLGTYPTLPVLQRTEKCNDLDQLSPKTRELCEVFLEKCKAEGLPVLITETYRTQERQEMLYEQGRTSPGAVVTWTRSSQHTSHRAFDIMKNVPGEEYTDEDFFRRCAEIGREVGLEAGYYWSVRDACHFQFDPWWIRWKRLFR